MSARSRKEVLEQARQRYGKRGREGRSRLLDEVCELCGYERKYVIKVLSGKRAIIGRGASVEVRRLSTGRRNARSSKRSGWRRSNPAANA